MNMQAPSFGGIAGQLVRQQLISESQMADAIQESRDQQKPLIDLLVSKGAGQAAPIAQAVAQLSGYPLLDLDAIDQNQISRELVEEKAIRQNTALPLFKRGNRLVVAISDPFRQQDLDNLRFAAKASAVEAVVVEADKLARLIESLYSGSSDFDFGESFDLDVVDTNDDSKHEATAPGSDDAPIVRFVNKMLVDAIKMGASDLHFEPYEKSYRVRFRVDGVLREMTRQPIKVAQQITARLKVMSQMDISEKRTPQDGRIKLKLSPTKAIDFRVNSLPTLFGEKVVLRILDPSSAMLGIDALGYEAEQKALFLEALHRPQGMMLITGPTGSGKTVSLYTGLNILNDQETNISTAEDPVEINLEGINQVNVNAKVGLTFAAALRSFLRQDPDVVMVGEIRDLETAEIAIKAAQTGHMVLSTLHTNSAPETLTRLRNMGVPSFNIATSVNLVIAQRLARRLCTHCRTPLKRPEEVTDNALLELGFTPDQLTADLVIYRPVGCSQCRNGYKGRVGIYEVMKITPEIARIIMEDGNSIQIAEAARAAGFDDLRRSGLRKVIAGMTSLEEVSRVTSD